MSKQESTKKKKEPQPRKPRTGCVGEPDVVVVVGGKEFLEHGKHLCCWSEYFDAALQSGMKESHTKRFEFPDQDPTEWKLITEMLTPSGKKITMANLDTILRWCNKLLIPSILDDCDNFILQNILNFPYKVRAGANADQRINKVLEYLPQCIEANLISSKARCLKILTFFLELSPASFTNNHLELMVSAMKDDKGCRSMICDHLRGSVPSVFPNHFDATTLDNELFPLLILSVCGTNRLQQEQRYKTKKNISKAGWVLFVIALVLIRLLLWRLQAC